MQFVQKKNILTSGYKFLSIKKRTIDYESINGTENLEYLNKNH